MNDIYYSYIENDPFMRTFMIPAVENTNNKFINVNEGFLKGNMEKGSYVPYKNMNYIKPVITNEQEDYLYKIQSVSFAAHDANLYLDTHPNDTNMIKLYNKYMNDEKMLVNEYESKYGPLDLYDTTGLNKTPWAWLKKPWPWNK